jgi:DNA-binding FrmR family transcriptional regulator
MSHTVREKKKLLNRVRRIRGQVDAIEKALDTEQDASSILQMIASCRGAMNGLIAEVIEGHIRLHIIDPTKKPTAEQSTAAEELIDVVRSYLK